METTIALIKGLEALGYKKLITTPHIYWDMYRNEAPDILQKAEAVTKELQARGIAVELTAAAEYFLDDHFSRLLKEETPLLTISDNKVLVEFSFASEPFDLQQHLFNLQIKGYKPVIAHPERYTYLHSSKEKYHDFYDQGCLLQLNLLSLSGYYGKQVQDMAKYLLKNKMVQLLGTDLHHFRHLNALNNKELFRLVATAIESGDIVNATL
jgi:tyrosine-protein phosphatase YwqE